MVKLVDSIPIPKRWWMQLESCNKGPANPHDRVLVLKYHDIGRAHHKVGLLLEFLWTEKTKLPVSDLTGGSLSLPARACTLLLSSG
jgi:hypothetical protein